MLISVAIPFYQELSLIGRAVASVCSQILPSPTQVSFEIFIGNDGTYTSDEIVSAIAEVHRPSVHVIRNDGPRGPGGARNACLHRATGEWIAFLDADDYWRPDKIQKQLRLAESGATFIPTAYAFEDSGISIIPPSTLSNSMDVFRKRGIGTSTILVHRAVCENKFFRDLRFAQDIDFWYALSTSAAFRYDAVCTPCVVYSRAGSTHNKLTQLRFVYKVLDLNKVPWQDRALILTSYATHGLLNHYLRRGSRQRSAHRLPCQ